MKTKALRIIGILGVAELALFAFIEDGIIAMFHGHDDLCITFMILYFLLAGIQIFLWLEPHINSEV